MGQCVLFGNRDAGKFGTYWVHNGRLVGALVEGGSKVEYAALAKTARERPHVKDISLLKKQGMDFVMFVAKPIPHMSLMNSITSIESNMLLSHPSKWVLQAGGGVVLGLAVVGVIYWFGSRRSRRKL